MDKLGQRIVLYREVVLPLEDKMCEVKIWDLKVGFPLLVSSFPEVSGLFTYKLHICYTLHDSLLGVVDCILCPRNNRHTIPITSFT